MHLVVAAAAIGDDLHAGQREANVLCGRCEQLLARLCCQHAVVQRQRRVAQRARALPRDGSDLRRQAVLLHLSRPLPALEVARLPGAGAARRGHTSVEANLLRSEHGS